MVSEYIIKENTTLLEYFSKRHLSISFLNKLILNNGITDDKSYLSKDSVLSIGQKIYINYSVLETNDSIDIYDYKDVFSKRDILFENSEVIAIDKKPKLLVHSDGQTHKTLLNAVCSYLRDSGDDSFIRPIHRIDYEARGIVLFSKNIVSYSEINYQMENKLLHKKYLILTEGIIDNNGTIEVNIGRNRHDSQKYLVSKSGKPCKTDYKILKHVSGKTLLEVSIITGRTHQIRVSFAHIHHPLVGDDLYGKKGKQLELISKEIGFILDDNFVIIKSNYTINGA